MKLRKKILINFSVMAIFCILFASNQSAKAGLFATRGKTVYVYVNANFTGTCCRYALFNSDCDRPWGGGNGC